MVKTLQGGRSIVGCSSGTIFEIFSVDHCHCIYHVFQFHCKCALKSFLQYGARSEGYNPEEGFHFSFEFVESVCFSHFCFTS